MFSSLFFSFIEGAFRLDFLMYRLVSVFKPVIFPHPYKPDA